VSVLSHENLSLAFGIRGTGKPSALSLGLFFGVKGFGKLATEDLALSFAVSPPPQDIYVFDRGDWQPVSQRVWDGSVWFPTVA
jgi:hypothetical protein